MSFLHILNSLFVVASYSKHSVRFWFACFPKLVWLMMNCSLGVILCIQRQKWKACHKPIYVCVCVKLEIVTKVDEFLLSLEFHSNCFSNIVMQPLHSTLWIFSTTTKKMREKCLENNCPKNFFCLIFAEIPVKARCTLTHTHEPKHVSYV